MSVEKYDVREDSEVWRIRGGDVKDLDFVMSQISEHDYDELTWRTEGDTLKIVIPMGTTMTLAKE